MRVITLLVFLFLHCEKDPRPHQVFPSLPCLSPIFLGGTWEQTLLIKDLPKKRWNTKWNKAGTWFKPRSTELKLGWRSENEQMALIPVPALAVIEPP